MVKKLFFAVVVGRLTSGDQRERGSNRYLTNLCVKKEREIIFLQTFRTVTCKRLADNLAFEKIKTWDRLKINTADPSNF
ncbi:MAG: hypothetical protein ACKO96_02655 [Flammeovirgaceae bacterium]